MMYLSKPEKIYSKNQVYKKRGYTEPLRSLIHWDVKT